MNESILYLELSLVIGCLGFMKTTPTELSLSLHLILFSIISVNMYSPPEGAASIEVPPSTTNILKVQFIGHSRHELYNDL